MSRVGEAPSGLASIKGPADLKVLPAADLPRLAEEVRSQIIETVARNGGHLAPNLGVVELTIALHRAFDSPRDRIVWDVGHQTYTHKLLTGRLDGFAGLRRDGGLSGFPRRAESPHDVFETGHASTSISAALGMAKARDLKSEGFSVVAVIGDGALTGGQAFEALNNAGHMKTDLIVILNDNEFSYGPTVGGLAAYLGRMRTSVAYSRLKGGLERAVKAVPIIGSALFALGGRLKGSLKYLVVKGMLFEELGFAYLGPIDGHSFPQLEDYLNRAKRIRGPVFLHVQTKKGKGYPPAERDPDRFHGTGPFDPLTGMPLPPLLAGSSNGGPSTSSNGGLPPSPARLSYTQAFGQALLRLGEMDSRIVVITAAMASSTGVLPFARRFPKRWFDVGICEQHAVTFAAGLAREGLRPVIAVYSTFLQRGYDQILHDVCLQQLPVTFMLDRAGLVGADGPTHHGVYDLAYLRSMPGMTVMAPRDENELQHMLKTAVYLGGPAAVRYPRGSGLGVALDEKLHRLPIGLAEVLREGADVAILAIGSMVGPAREAAERLAEGLPAGRGGPLGRRLEATVVNARFAAPLDTALVARLGGSVGALLTVEEHVSKGGFGSAVAEAVADAGLGLAGCQAVYLRRLALPDEPVVHGKVEGLLARLGLDAAAIARAARDLVVAKLAEDRGGG
jgi:1-deoxy-D-xylulose-5-phosphate synthase